MLEITPELLSPGLARAAALLHLLLLALSLRHLPWTWLRRDERLERYGASVAALLALWQLRAVLGGGPTIHLLGATLLTLAFGWRLALLGLTLVMSAATLAGGTGWSAWGANGGLIALAVAVSYGTARASQLWLAPNPFVYFFVAGFLGAALAVAASSAAAVLLLLAAARASHEAILANYLPSALLMLFPEAFLTGALVTLAVVYRPRWLVSYRDRDYLDG